MRFLFAGWPLVGALLLAACDAAPGLPDAPGRAPLVTGLTITPDEVLRNTLPAEQIDGDTARVPVTFSVTATDPDDAISGVQAVVLSPTNSLRPVAVVPLVAEGSHYQATAPVAFPLDGTGVYAVVVIARDSRGQAGQVLGRLTYTRINNAPVVEGVAGAPTPFPAAGGLFTLTARVSDPEGLEDVVRVAATSPGGTFRLFDDGKSFGDEAAGDGVFTARFEIPAGATSSDLTFSVQATDRAGAVSNTVALVVPVQ